MKTYGEVEVLDEGEGSISRYSHSTAITHYRSIGGWTDPRAFLDAVVKTKILYYQRTDPGRLPCSQ
jgi:hypothetical protein